MRQHHDVTAETEDKLDEALALLASGMPLETILAEAGEDEAWLRPLLEIAADVDTVQQNIPIPPPDASLNKMLAHAETVRAGGASAPQPGWLAGLAALFGKGASPLALGFKTAALAVSLVFAFLAGTVLGGSLTAAAHDSLPGQPYYGLKRAAENVRLSLTWSPVRRGELVETYNHRRQMEAELLLEQGQTAAINFESVIQTVTGSTISLAGGLTAQITAETVVEGELAPGARVRIEAETRPPGSLQARAITVIKPGPPTPTPTATPTATASPTPQPTAAPTRARIEDTLVLPPTDDLPDDAFEESAPDDEDGDDLDDEDDDRDDNANDNAGDDLDNEDDDRDDNANDNTDDDRDDDAGDDDFDDNEDEDDLDDDLDDDQDNGDDFDDDDLDDDLDDDFEDDSSGNEDDNEDSEDDSNSGSGGGSDDNSGSGSDNSGSNSDSDDDDDDGGSSGSGDSDDNDDD